MTDKRQTANKDLKELSLLRQNATMITRLKSNVHELIQDIASLEQDLSKTGSSKTAGQLKGELDDITLNM